MKPQDFSLMLVKDMSHEASVSTEHLPRHRSSHGVVLFCYEPDVVPLGVEDNVFVRLLKPNHHIHELQLSLYHDSRIRQDAGRRVLFVENTVGVLWNVNRR